ncbi:hypothetical protein BKH41_03885 [Helicobacter sp. 12S02232-10]|uniref:GPW/gp25 family protein n=1 Tax=Helicobacter sp. 12S02232-10 TaxID=1476197 RepID=UPI000BA4E870|nr:GPW/gp25 family protein [Helicobacter sp. 12S02232-10]PAF49229.1 hypothetical protein BKH41_03885 [Helicobacter sp. 12S02232-10]
MNQTINTQNNNNYKLSINENLNRIFKTKKYSIPLNPNFGLSYDWIDKPLTPETRLAITEEVQEQIRLYEPRLNIQNIAVGFEDSKLIISINSDYQVVL